MIYFLADLISLLDVNPHNDQSGIILESEFFDEADFALRYSNIQRRVVSARIGNICKLKRYFRNYQMLFIDSYLLNANREDWNECLIKSMKIFFRKSINLHKNVK